MGFIEDIGRSNALGSVNSLMGKAIEMRQGDDRSAERAYTLGMETEKLGMLKDNHELDANKKRMELKRSQEEETHAQFKTDVSTNPIMRQLPEAVRKDALEWGKQQGYWDENNIGSRRNQKRAYEELTSNKEVFNRFMWPTTQAHKANLEGAIAELNAEQEKDTPNPEKIAKIQQRVKGLQKIYDTATDSYSKMQEHFDKLEEIKAKSDGGAALGFKDIPGGSIPGTEPGKMYQGLPKGIDPQGNPVFTNVVEKPVAVSGETKSHTLDKPDPKGKVWPGGTIWERGPNGDYTKYIGPAPKSATQQGAQILNEPLSEKEQKTVDTFVRGIKEGKVAPSQMNSFLTSRGTGSVAKMKIAIGAAAIDSGINLPEAEANYKAKSSQFAVQRVQLAKTVLPMADAFIATVDKIPEGLGFVPADDFARKVGRSMNSETLAALEFQKNKLVEEFERMLTGAQMADSRVQRNLDLIKSGYDKKILKWMAEEVKKISQISINASTSDMYPNAGGGNTPPPGTGSLSPAAQKLIDKYKGKK